MKNVKPIIPIVLTLVGLGVGFLGGYQYRTYKLRTTGGNFMMGVGTGGQRFFRGAGGGMMGRGAAIGSILSVDDKGITVKLVDGSSKIVLFSDATTFSNTVSATRTDLKQGTNVAVFGAPNSDGSLTATSVQINPEFGRPQGTPSPK